MSWKSDGGIRKGGGSVVHSRAQRRPLLVVLVGCLALVLTLLSMHAFDARTGTIPQPAAAMSAASFDVNDTGSATISPSEQPPVTVGELLLCAALGLVCALGAIAFARLARFLRVVVGAGQRLRLLLLGGLSRPCSIRPVAFTLDQLSVSRV
ncbi:protein of unknown function [Agreia sp. COWG]|nr:protein of unknown function [Agreia sp. COWG]